MHRCQFCIHPEDFCLFPSRSSGLGFVFFFQMNDYLWRMTNLNIPSFKKLDVTFDLPTNDCRSSFWNDCTLRTMSIWTNCNFYSFDLSWMRIRVNLYIFAESPIHDSSSQRPLWSVVDSSMSTLLMTFWITVWFSRKPSPYPPSSHYMLFSTFNGSKAMQNHFFIVIFNIYVVTDTWLRNCVSRSVNCVKLSR